MSTALLAGVLMLAQGATDFEVRTPPKPDRYLRCRCAAPTADVLTFTGAVADAELRLGADGRSVAEIQTTVFTIVDSDDIGEDRVRVSHPTTPEKCGVAFDYGKRYEIRAVREDGDLRTDYCLLGKPSPADKAE